MRVVRRGQPRMPSCCGASARHEDTLVSRSTTSPPPGEMAWDLMLLYMLTGKPDVSMQQKK